MGEKYRSWSADEKMEIILAGLRGDQSVAEVCRQYDIQQSQYYQWRGENVIGSPDPDTIIKKEDILMVIGSQSQVDKLEKLCQES